MTRLDYLVRSYMPLSDEKFPHRLSIEMLSLKKATFLNQILLKLADN